LTELAPLINVNSNINPVTRSPARDNIKLQDYEINLMSEVSEDKENSTIDIHLPKLVLDQSISNSMLSNQGEEKGYL
jgi:hypothetical protein